MQKGDHIGLLVSDMGGKETYLPAVFVRYVYGGTRFAGIGLYGEYMEIETTQIRAWDEVPEELREMNLRPSTTKRNHDAT